MNQSIDQSICPFCHNKNACMAESADACWCVNAVIPGELIDLVPEELKNKSCICNNCVTLFLQDPEKFTAN